MEQPRKCSHVAFWVVIGILGLFLVASFAMNLGFLIGLAGGAAEGGEGEDEFPKLTERWSYGEGKVKAARIAVDGVIFRDSEESFFGARYDWVESVLRQIRAAQNDEDVKAIILEVNSPGGELTPTDEIFQALLDFQDSADGRLVVAFVQDMAASGGYYIAAAADWIVAEPTAMLGSIGVIMQTLNWKVASEKIGITDTTIKSGTNKDLLNPFHDVPPEQIALLQEMTDTLYQRFFDIVRTCRDLDAGYLQTVADGRIFTADYALENRFIDQIGYWTDVAAKTRELLGEAQVKIVRYEHKPSLFELFSEVKMPLSFSRIAEAATPRFLYLWRP